MVRFLLEIPKNAVVSWIIHEPFILFEFLKMRPNITPIHQKWLTFKNGGFELQSYEKYHETAFSYFFVRNSVHHCCTPKFFIFTPIMLYIQFHYLNLGRLQRKGTEFSTFGTFCKSSKCGSISGLPTIIVPFRIYFTQKRDR